MRLVRSSLKGVMVVRNFVRSVFVVTLFILLMAIIVAAFGIIFAYSSPGLIRMLSGHSLWVMSVSWSPDGKLLASGSEDTSARIWQAGSGDNVATLTSFRGGVVSVAWSPDSKHLATGSTEPNFQVFDH